MAGIPIAVAALPRSAARFTLQLPRMLGAVVLFLALSPHSSAPFSIGRGTGRLQQSAELSAPLPERLVVSPRLGRGG